MNNSDKKTVAEATQTLAALLDLVQGFACESGTEALERYSRDPVGLMDRATGVLGKLKRLAGAAEPEEKKCALPSLRGAPARGAAPTSRPAAR